MDYDGLMISYIKYRFPDIELVDDERKYQLLQNEEIDLQGRRVMDDVAVVHLSSNYAEIVFFCFFRGGGGLFSDDVSGSYDRKST